MVPLLRAHSRSRLSRALINILRSRPGNAVQSRGEDLRAGHVLKVLRLEGVVFWRSTGGERLRVEHGDIVGGRDYAAGLVLVWPISRWIWEGALTLRVITPLVVIGRPPGFEMWNSPWLDIDSELSEDREPDMDLR